MPRYSNKSKDRLRTCDDRLQRIFEEVIKHFDCTILCGHRGYEDQTRLYKEGKSQLSYPHSKHNQWPAMAADVAPYPIDFNDLNRFRYFAGFVMGVAAATGIKLRSGLDWDMDTELKDNKFFDAAHFELVD